MEHLRGARPQPRGQASHVSAASGADLVVDEAMGVPHEHPPGHAPLRRAVESCARRGDPAFDKLLDHLRDPSRGVPTPESRLRGLLQANQVIAADLSLVAVTAHVGQAARLLLGAGYCALGVVTAQGDTLERIVESAADDAVANRVSSGLEGKGVLSLLVDVTKPVRMSGLDAVAPAAPGSADDRSVTRFLAVPIRVRGAIYGHLYLADGDAEAFTRDDLELATVFAATASIAIENAIRHDDAARRCRWLEASAEVILHLIRLDSDADRHQALAERMCVMADADVVSVVVPSGHGGLGIRAVAGDRSEQLLQATMRAAGPAAAAALDSDRPVPVLAGLAMAVPLVGARVISAALVAGRRPGRVGFGQDDLEMAAMFARHAVASLDLSAAHADKQRDLLLGDRDRLATALNRSIIRRLFAAGLRIHSIAASLESPPAAERLAEVADDLDETIRQIRARIFDDGRAD